MGITISLDYCFMTTDEAEEDMRAVLVAYDHSKSALWAIPVEHKGAQTEVVKWFADKCEESGYAGVSVTLKSDQEPAMLSLKQATAISRKAVTPINYRVSCTRGKSQRQDRESH